MIYYLALYLICCTILFIGVIRYKVQRDGGITGREMLQVVLTIFMPGLNIFITTLAMLDLLVNFIENNEVLNKTYFTGDTE